jgi:hypothetical protein
MNIDKTKLKKAFEENDWNFVFDKAYEITDFILTSEFKIFDEEKREVIRQECIENLWKKIVNRKCDPNQNLFSFFWINSRYRILEILRKENGRKRIATFLPFDDCDKEVYSGDSTDGVKYVNGNQNLESSNGEST